MNLTEGRPSALQKEEIDKMDTIENYGVISQQLSVVMSPLARLSLFCFPKRKQMIGKARDGFEGMLAVGYLGAFLVTYEVLPLLKSSLPSGIINVSANGVRSTQSKENV